MSLTDDFVSVPMEETMAETQDGPILARFRCHKIVAAGEIRGLINGDNGKVEALMVQTADGTNSEVCPGDGFFARKTPALGDYYVVYDDGYASWSPASAFEDGYTKIEG
jgi:hypothetical protein